MNGKITKIEFNATPKISDLIIIHVYMYIINIYIRGMNFNLIW